ncbi:peptidoglycan editing factor PgeF [Desulforhopalus vacuolatus]|uniref:peptidoglycan editing factor PgeF n=1 Tax=Desulforhopalus vacuolatus TaxID=40414 RepID=UPI00196537BC|nr:peptidoglycan editing factor PgeF [Desulforhopalus vacuolatus]MBM9520299.1 peptidoglycan editing factor PgeF [Desulforhopalus vacuolatus]
MNLTEHDNEHRWQGGVFPSVDKEVDDAGERVKKNRAVWVCTNRHGGCSEGIYDSLNVGLQVDDQYPKVVENRHRISQALNLNTLLFVHQTHGTTLLTIGNLQGGSLYGDIDPGDGCDGMITALTHVGLAIQTADCQAVLLHDPVHSVIAAAHCGWRGSVRGILPAVVSRMVQDFDSNPDDIHAVISPALGACCAEFVHYHEELPESFLPFRSGKNFFDFPAISTMQLTKAGLQKENIRSLNICTSCDENYFSWRRTVREGGKTTGRNCSVIFLDGDEK